MGKAWQIVPLAGMEQVCEKMEYLKDEERCRLRHTSYRGGWSKINDDAHFPSFPSFTWERACGGNFIADPIVVEEI
jgi:hypothetical protein